MPISTKSIRASFRSKNEQKKRFALYFLLPSTFFFLRFQLSVRWYFGDLKVGNTNRETKNVILLFFLNVDKSIKRRVGRPLQHDVLTISFFSFCVVVTLSLLLLC
jgi:hypothetical protein